MESVQELRTDDFKGRAFEPALLHGNETESEQESSPGTLIPGTYLDIVYNSCLLLGQT